MFQKNSPKDIQSSLNIKNNNNKTATKLLGFDLIIINLVFLLFWTLPKYHALYNPAEQKVQSYMQKTYFKNQNSASVSLSLNIDFCAL